MSHVDQRKPKYDADAAQTRAPTHDGREPGKDLVEYLKDYAREKPEVAALWCVGIGFVLGWKLKPW